MIDDIRAFFANGPQRRAAMEAALDRGLNRYLGPTGIPARLDAISEVLNPVRGIEHAGSAAQTMANSNLSWPQRVGAGGRMLTEIAGVVAPAAAVRFTGIGGDDAARALEEAYLGMSASPGAVAGRDFAMDESGMFLGVNAKTADLDALSRAQKMAEGGASRENIWDETGWFQGVDGKWRFEIDDSSANLTNSLLNKVSSGGEARTNLSGGVFHPSLFRAYPENETSFGLGSSDFDYTQSGGAAGGGYYPDSGKISVTAPDELSGRSVALHELQHAVQGREGFASGASPHDMWFAHMQLTRKAQAHFDAMALLDEVERNGGDWTQALKDFDEIGTPIGADGQELARQFGDAKTARSAFEQVSAAKQKLEPLREVGRWEQDAGYGPYRRTAGEVEARNVQTRRNMNAEQRRQSPPWMTQDIPDENQILVFGDQVQLLNALRTSAGPIPRLDSLPGQ